VVVSPAVSKVLRFPGDSILPTSNHGLDDGRMEKVLVDLFA